MQFSSIPGKREVKDHLITEIRSGRLPHLHLFHGREGSGELLMALAFAQYLMCENRGEQDSCGTCNSCVKAQTLAHPDLHLSFPVIKEKTAFSSDHMAEWRDAVLENPFLTNTDWMRILKAENKQGIISTDECRKIIRDLTLKSFENEHKVLVLWLPEYFSRGGQTGNTLLKFLEEPTPNTHIVLVTNAMDQLLATIISRSQIVQIPDFEDEEISSYLGTVREVSPERAKEAAFLADGNMNKAIKLSSDQEVSAAQQFERWMSLCKSSKNQPLMDFSDELAGLGRERLKDFLIQCIGILREFNALHHVPEHRMRIPGELTDFRRKFASFIDHECVAEMYENLNDAAYHIGQYANARIELFQLSLALRRSLQKQNHRKKQGVAS